MKAAKARRPTSPRYVPRITAAANDDAGPSQPAGRWDALFAPLIQSWHDFATALDVRAADPTRAKMVENLARELKAFLRGVEADLLDADAAARWSGYTTDHLRRLAAAGKIKNYGKKGAPLYRRSELPIKSSSAGSLHVAQRSTILPGTREQIARAAITQFVGGRDG